MSDVHRVTELVVHREGEVPDGMAFFFLVLGDTFLIHHGDACEKISASLVQFPLDEDIGWLLFSDEKVAHFSFLKGLIGQDRLHQRLDQNTFPAAIF